MGPFIGIFGAVVVAMIGITTIFGSWYTVDQGERGVILRNGKLVGTATPGLGFKMPWVDGVVKISVQSKLKTYDKMAIYSRDQQTAEVRLSVGYRATESGVDEIYAQFGGLDGVVDRLISPKVFEEAKTVFGRYNAVTAINERQRLNFDIREAVTKAVGSSVIQIENVQIENIDFSDVYEKAIEARMTAEVEVQKVRQNAEREKVSAEILVIQANAAADATRAKAKAEADAITFKGDAEAGAIKAKSAALAQNQNLVNLIAMEKWNGTLPTTMLPGGAVPMIGLPK